jgi:hypothetical protein
MASSWGSLAPDWRDEEAAANLAAGGGRVVQAAPTDYWGSLLGLAKTARTVVKPLTDIATGNGLGLQEDAIGLGRGLYEQAKSGFTLPGDVYAGRTDPNSDEAIRRSTDLAMTMPLAAMPLSMAVPEGSGSLGVFAGRAGANRLAGKGVTGPKAALDLAESMGAAGASRDEIYAATNRLLEGTPYAGATRGVDNKLRFEIDDSGMKLGDPGNASIGEHYSHPEFFSAYPSVKNEWSTLRIKPSAEPGGTGSYSSFPGLMSVSARTADEATDVAAHELQHAAQSREGFSSGTNAGKGLWGALAPFSAAARKKAWNRYWTNPGEVEARNAANRLTLSPEQRRATPPWQTADVPPEAQWGSLSAPR